MNRLEEYYDKYDYVLQFLLSKDALKSLLLCLEYYKIKVPKFILIKIMNEMRHIKIIICPNEFKCWVYNYNITT